MKILLSIIITLLSGPALGKSTKSCDQEIMKLWVSGYPDVSQDLIVRVYGDSKSELQKAPVMPVDSKSYTWEVYRVTSGSGAVDSEHIGTAFLMADNNIFVRVSEEKRSLVAGSEIISTGPGKSGKFLAFVEKGAKNLTKKDMLSMFASKSATTKTTKVKFITVPIKNEVINFSPTDSKQTDVKQQSASTKALLPCRCIDGLAVIGIPGCDECCAGSCTNILGVCQTRNCTSYCTFDACGCQRFGDGVPPIE